MTDTEVNRDFFIRLWKKGQTRCPDLISMQILRQRFGDKMAEKWRDLAYGRGVDVVKFTQRIGKHKIEFAGK